MKLSLESFLAEISLSKSAPTVQAYGYDIAQFLAYLTSSGVKRITSIKGTHIIGYLGACKKEGKADASINRYFMAIRCYCLFLRRRKYISENLTEDIIAPKSALKAPYVPSIAEIELLLNAPSKDTQSGLRDRAILELLYSSGLRVSELCSLALEDLRSEGVHIACGKRAKTRTVPVTGSALEAINVYIETHRGKDSGPLFRTLMGKALNRQLLCKLVETYARKAGVSRVTPHTLRHACATHLLDNGADLRLIQEVLGHSSIASTQRYTHLSSNKMQSMFKQFHPRKGI